MTYIAEDPRVVASYVDRTLADEIERLARANERSTSAQIRKALKEHVIRSSAPDSHHRPGFA